MKRTTIIRAAVLAMLSGVVAPACSEDDLDLFPKGQPPGGASFEPAPGGLRRLLSRQYVSSVRVLLGDAAAAAASPPNDSGLYGFDSIAAAELSLPASAVGAYESSARAIASAAVGDPATLTQILPCTPSGAVDASCHRQFVTSFGRLAWRRALAPEEIDRITGVAQAAATEYQDFNAGVGYAISALLQSPNFLYMVEIGEPHPTFPEMRQLTKHELATRMSFFLVGQTPGPALLDYVDGHELTADEIREVAAALVQMPEARAELSAFYGEILRIRDVEDISKDPALFPQFNPQLAHAMKEETLRLVEDVVWTRDADLRELLTADYTYVNADLAGIYGITPPSGDAFVKVTLPEVQKRSGLLSTTAYLARFAHPDKNSPTRRGLFVVNTLLCDEIPPPPPGVDTTLPPPQTPTTLKAQLEQHMENDNCRGCHVRMDTIGFALENYNAIGAFRTLDNGFPIDSSSGEVEGLGSFSSAQELGVILKEDPRVPLCVVKNLVRSSLGHLETPGEKPAIDAMRDAFVDSGYRMQALLVELVASPAFQFVGEPK